MPPELSAKEKEAKAEQDKRVVDFMRLHEDDDLYISMLGQIEKEQGKNAATEFLKRYAFLHGSEGIGPYRNLLAEVRANITAEIDARDPKNSFIARDAHVNDAISQMYPDAPTATAERSKEFKTDLKLRSSLKRGGAGVLLGLGANMGLWGYFDEKNEIPKGIGGLCVLGITALAMSDIADKRGALIEIIDYINPIIEEKLRAKALKAQSHTQL